LFLIADRQSEKYLKKLIGKKDVEDALSRLDKLTREEFQAAIAQVLKVTHDVGQGVKNVGEKVDVVDAKVDGVGAKVDGVDATVKDIDDKVNVAVDGTLITSATRKRCSKPVQLDGKVVKVTTMETKTLVQQAEKKMEEAKRPLFYIVLLSAVYAEISFQVSRHGRTTERGCLRQTLPLIRTLRPAFNMKGRPRGSSRGVSLRSGGPGRPHPCYGYTANVRGFPPITASPILISSNHRSGFRKERPLVRHHLSGPRARNLSC